MMKKWFRTIIVLLSVVFLLSACGGGQSGKNDGEQPGNNENSEEKKVITMATSADYPPFESRTPDGEFEGFDIDLARAIAEELGYELKIEDMKFDG